MTTTPAHRRMLPMLGHTRGGRSATVCHWKCGDACASPAPNPTLTSPSGAAPTFAQVVEASLTRRTVLTGGAAAAAVAAGSALSAAPAAAGTPAGAPARRRRRALAFSPIAPVAADVDALTVPDGWVWSTVVAWGDPVLPGAAPLDLDDQTPQAQAGQFGYNNDFLAILRDSDTSAVLVANHEYTNDELMFPGYDPENPTEQQLRTSIQAHGMSVVELHRDGRGRPWRYVQDGARNRRITGTTVFRLDGPAAGSPLLRTAGDATGTRVLGTLNNCAGGLTPWGTVLSGEENVNQYFAAAPVSDPQTGAPLPPDPRLARYGLTSPGRRWERVDPRFDTAATGYANEANRFGWVVEVDPQDPRSTPRKHTALGRFKHEGATVTLAGDGRAVVYMGDDERFDYLYKFVSRDRMRRGGNRRAREHNRRLLQEGDLYVARFLSDGAGDGTSDGSGSWLPLVVDGRSAVYGRAVDGSTRRWTVEEVLVYTRLAADLVQPTPMDRPEDVQPDPRTGKVYLACTNNTRRTAAQVDGANPRAQNKSGHVVEITEHRDDAAATTFSWRLFLVCGDPADPSTYFAGYEGPVSPVACPDNVTFDGSGDLWISTDGQSDALGYSDALHRVDVTGPERGRVQQFLAVPTGAETCGPVIDVEDGSVFVCVQHPGDVEDADPAAPASLFPYDDTYPVPRPAVVQVHRG